MVLGLKPEKKLCVDGIRNNLDNKDNGQVKQELG
jgi:hypothetical protein